MNRLTITNLKATVVVGLDFGTTFSGFAYALASQPKKIMTFFDWPAMAAAGGKLYCKTQTSLLYVPGETQDSYVLQDWAYEALLKYAHGLQSQETKLKGITGGEIFFCSGNQSRGKDLLRRSGQFITNFKLHLAGCEETSAADLPKGLTPRRVISDYLRKIAQLIITTLQNNLGEHITMKDIQWCLTVPAIWDERAKHEMKRCAEIAGLVQGPDCQEEDASPHPVIIVLEPEAASLYCQQKVEFPLNVRDKFMVVDVGGGTVDLVLHEKMQASGLKVREVSPSSGGLYGGTYVDLGFFEFLSQRIRCFRKFAQEQPQTILKLKGWWEAIKYTFSGDLQFPYELDLPAKLARAWEEDEASRYPGICQDYASYDSIELALEDMHTIFDPVVDKILELIEAKMIPDLRAMMIVGGFSASPYLVNRIRQDFSHRLEAIIIPKDPGSAVCCGAVSYGIGGPDLIMSRISKKTYGINSTRMFHPDDPVHLMMRGEHGEMMCRDMFKIFTREGNDVPLDSCVSHKLCPLYKHQTECKICLYSTSERDPKYIDDTGVSREGTFTIRHPSENELGSRPKFRVSMYFGRTTIEVKAVGKNFGEGEEFTMPPVIFEKTFE